MYNIDTREISTLIHADNIESSAFDQIKTIKHHPSLIGLIAIMPDVHAGAGCVIGFTGKFGNSIIPSIVGVDIGCGVLTYRLPADADLDLEAIYTFIAREIPCGFNSHTHMKNMPAHMKDTIVKCEKLVKEKKLKANPAIQAGTLGGGNHFIEIERSPETGETYLTIHSGSRKFGLEVAKYHQNKAKKLVEGMGITVPRDLEYLPMDNGGKEYYADMQLAQEYAKLNRMLMLLPILDFIGVRYSKIKSIESVHNYISPKDKVARKGAISAHLGEMVVIPLSMGKDGGIVIGSGLGNTKYNNSAPHGSGRMFGRKEMKRRLKFGEVTMDGFEDVMDGVYSESVCEGTIDESPFAYKPFEQIEKYLKETVNIVDIARPILAFKST